MTFHIKNCFRHVGIVFSVSLFVLSLVACDWRGGSAASSSTPSPQPSPTSTSLPSPTPTRISALTIYKGVGYTIGYPMKWKVSVGSDGFVSFSDPQGVTYLSIASQPNPQEAVSSSTLVDTGLQVFQSQAKNYQRLDVDSQTTLAQEMWSQGAATGDITSDDQTSTVTAKVIVIADNHPAHSLHTRGFVIAYGTDLQMFSLMNARYFQLMLYSFRFTQK